MPTPTGSLVATKAPANVFSSKAKEAARLKRIDEEMRQAAYPWRV